MGLSTGREKLGSMANTSRMTSYQRREQLIEIGRSLFAAKGFEAVSVEEIASTAKVSKPIVYEHFGGKEGLYAVVVDPEMRALTDVLINALSDPQATHLQLVQPMTLPNGVATRTVGCPVRIDGQVVAVDTRPPSLGEHTAQVLGRLAG